jgi:methionine synthase II (cobalamin-independent)
MTKIKALTTGIGSLPYTDVDVALDLIFKYTPQIPFWPQLPHRDKRESMVAQYSEGLPFLRVNQDGLSFDSSMQEQELTEFYEHVIANDEGYFRISADFAAGFWKFISRLEKENLNQIEFIKGQVTGPFTFCASINDNEGRAILHNPVLMQAFREGLAMKAIWQINLLRKFKKPIIIFLDEPYLACLGSGFTAINRKDVVDVLREFTNKIKSAQALIGVHCCGNTDWSIFTEVTNIDVISFDAFNFLDRVLLYADQLHDFLNRGGWIAWGIVPTEAFSPEINASALAQKLKQSFNLLHKKGIDKDLLKKRLILTPSCGLGTLGPDKAGPIFECLAKLSSLLD